MKFRRIWKIFEIWKNYEFYEIWKISVILINLWDSTEFGNSLRTHRFTRSSLPNIMKQKLIQRLLRQVNSLEEDMQKILPPNCINHGTRCSLLLGVDQGWAWSIWARPFQILWWQVKRVTAWVTKKKKKKRKGRASAWRKNLRPNKKIQSCLSPSRLHAKWRSGNLCRDALDVEVGVYEPARQRSKPKWLELS